MNQPLPPPTPNTPPPAHRGPLTASQLVAILAVLGTIAVLVIVLLEIAAAQ